MANKELFKLLSKRLMIFLLPVLLIGLITLVLTTSAGDPCGQGGTAGGTPGFVDSCKD